MSLLEKLTKIKKKKKDKPRPKYKGTGLKIVDEDNFSSFRVKLSDEDDDQDVEEQPQIAAVLDDRPEDVKARELFDKGNNKWKQIGLTETSSRPRHDSSDDDEPKAPRRHDSSEDDDASPPRSSRRRHDSEEDSPPRIVEKSANVSSRHDSDQDLSPSRKRANVPPPAKNRKKLDDDLSPPRRRKNLDDDLSPPRIRKDSDGDLLPPRRRNNPDGDLSPPRIRKDSDGDFLLPRRRNNPDDDFSPPRRKQVTRNLSPPRRNHRDLSPPRKRNYSPKRRDSPSRRPESSSRARIRDSPPPSHARHGSIRSRHESNRSSESKSSSRWNRDLSPPRKQQQDCHSQKNQRRIVEPSIIEDNDNEPSTGERMSKTLDGKKAGLQRASALRSELTDLRAKEDEMFANMDDEILGKNAKTKVRDKETGKLKDFAKEAEENAAKEKKAAEWKAQYDKWGRGLKQVEDMAEKVSTVVHEMSKPLARYSDDKDLDDYLKKQDRDGDPMLKFLTKKAEKGPLGGGSRKPMYMGPPPAPNRFNIRPGARWDGVDRSNGYEKEWFGRINAKKAFMDEAYKWSSEDL